MVHINGPHILQRTNQRKSESCWAFLRHQDLLKSLFGPGRGCRQITPFNSGVILCLTSRNAENSIWCWQGSTLVFFMCV